MQPFSLLITFILCVTSHAYAQSAQPSQPDPGSNPALLLQQANQYINSGRTQLAQPLLDTILKQEKLNPILKHTAQLLKSHTTGRYQQRMTTWLNRKIANTVVLVPDQYSALKAMQQWTSDRYWPVLIEDGWFTPIFIDAFKPNRIVRWQATPPKTQNPPANPDQKPDHTLDLLRTLLTNNNKFLGEQLKEQTPPGIVIIDPNSEQRIAGTALALGRGQPGILLTLKTEGKPYANIPDIQKLSNASLHIMNQWKMLSINEWSAITLAGDYPWRYRPDKDYKPNLPKGIPYQWAPFGTTDLVGRDNNNSRLAVTGQLHGDAIQTLYQAMASMFIQPKKVLLFDDYTNRGGNFEPYTLSESARQFRTRYDVDFVLKKQVTPANFRNLTHPVNPYDLIFINSSGGDSNWQLRGSATQNDIMIGRPVAVHIIQSFSAANLDNKDTIAGRALQGGAFWYYGSVWEPYLFAFAQPTGITTKALAGTPLAFGAKHIPGHPLYVPWRLTLIGDPLYTLRKTPAERFDLNLYPESQPLIETLKNEISKENKDWPTILRLSIIIHAGTPNTTLGQFSPGMTNAALNSLTQLNEIHPSDLGQIALRLIIAKQDDAFSKIPLKTAARNSIMLAEVKSAYINLYHTTIKANDTDNAQPMLKQIIDVGDSKENIRKLCKLYLTTMKNKSQLPQALEFFKQYTTLKDSPGSIKYTIIRAIEEWEKGK